MPQVEINFEVYKNGFSSKNYRNQVIAGNGRSKKFTKNDFRAILSFILQCMKSYNSGARGLQYGRGQQKRKGDK